MNTQDYNNSAYLAQQNEIDSIQPVAAQDTTNAKQLETHTETEVPKVPKSIKQNVTASFEVMGIGLIGIFVFMIIFFAAIKLLEKLFPHKEEK